MISDSYLHILLQRRFLFSQRAEVEITGLSAERCLRTNVRAFDTVLVSLEMHTTNKGLEWIVLIVRSEVPLKRSIFMEDSEG